MTHLDILVPSRGRPGNLERLYQAVAATAAGNWHLWVRLDEDDPTALDYPAHARVTYITGPRTRFVASSNELAEAALNKSPSGESRTTHFAVLGDDVLPETVGWDLTLIEALNGRVGVAYGSDGLENKHGVDLPTHVVVPVEFYEALGWLALPTLRHLFVDNVWRELGQGLGVFEYRPDVKLTHLHPWAGLAQRDTTYAEANDARMRSVDKTTFERWRDGGGLETSLRRLRP